MNASLSVSQSIPCSVSKRIYQDVAGESDRDPALHSRNSRPQPRAAESRMGTDMGVHSLGTTLCPVIEVPQWLTFLILLGEKSLAEVQGPGG